MPPLGVRSRLSGPYNPTVTRFLLRGAFIGTICAALVCLASFLNPSLFNSEWLFRDAFTRPIAPRNENPTRASWSPSAMRA